MGLGFLSLWFLVQAWNLKNLEWTDLIAVDTKLLVKVLPQSYLLQFDRLCKPKVSVQTKNIFALFSPSNVLFVACFRWQVYYSSNMEIYNFREYPTRILSTLKHRVWIYIWKCLFPNILCANVNLNAHTVCAICHLVTFLCVTDFYGKYVHLRTENN